MEATEGPVWMDGRAHQLARRFAGGPRAAGGARRFPTADGGEDYEEAGQHIAMSLVNSLAIPAICTTLGISRWTFYRYLQL